MKSAKAKFATEADMCRLFIDNLPAEWTAYPETAGFDILLVRPSDGAQIGIEAKLSINARVVEQIAEIGWHHSTGPDFRAVLVPYDSTGLRTVLRLIGVTLISIHSPETKPYWQKQWFSPELPTLKGYVWMDEQYWQDFAPIKRHDVPEYVPDVAAGASGPSSLSHWKVKAIKIAVILERRGFVSRQDFKDLQIDINLWRNSFWIIPKPDERGVWIAGPHMRDFRAMHPKNYQQIFDDYDKWLPKPKTLPL